MTTPNEPPNEPRANPFPGLRPFEAGENHLFFGRDGQSDELLGRLRRSRFLAVVGTSGSGKSSLVRAGLLPALHGGFMIAAGSDWRVALFRPGDEPTNNLAVALCAHEPRGANDEDADLLVTLTEATLRRSALGLVEVVRHARLSEGKNLLIVVDQFEEIFRFKQNARTGAADDEAAAFVKLLLTATQQTDVPIYVVITMRSDFLGDCAQFRDLPEAINAGQYLIPRMTRDQRREAITGPIAVSGGAITPRLVNRLLNDVGDNPDQLPLLQHALMRAWQAWAKAHRADEPLDLLHYEAIGGMAAALSRHADQAYNELPDERSRLLAEQMFKSLTEKGADNREVRRPTKLKDLCAVCEASEAELIAVIDQFRRPGRSFLMPPVDVALDADALIDISHESLIRGWQRLKDWVDEESRSAQIYRRLGETTALYKVGKAGLWRDPDLLVALTWREQRQPNEAWARRYYPEFAAAMGFLDESRATRDRELAERERKRKRDLRRTRLTAATLLVAFLVTLLLGVFALYARQRAEASARQAESALHMALEAKKAALAAKEEAEAARREAIKQKDEAEAARHRAEAGEKLAEEKQRETAAAQRRAEQQAQIARQNLRQAQTAQQAAQTAYQLAERRRHEIAQSAAWIRAQNRITNNEIVQLARRLAEISSPQEQVFWRTRVAKALTKVGEHREAIDEATSAIKLDPENPAARLVRATGYFLDGQPERSVADLEKTIALNPNSYFAHVNMGMSLGQLGRYDAAAQEINTASKFYYPKFSDDDDISRLNSELSPEIKRVTGNTALLAMGNAFKDALRLELANLQAYEGSPKLADTLAAAARQHPPLEAYLSAINWAWLHQQRRPQDYGALVGQGALWEQAGYKDVAGRAYTQFIQEHTTRGDARYEQLARWSVERLSVLYPRGMPAAELNPPAEEPDAYSLYIEAVELQAQDRYSEAKEKLDAALKQHPEMVEARSLRVFLLMKQDNAAGAIEDCNIILRDYPQSPMAYFARGISSYVRLSEALTEAGAMNTGAMKDVAPEALAKVKQDTGISLESIFTDFRNTYRLDKYNEIVGASDLMVLMLSELSSDLPAGMERPVKPEEIISLLEQSTKVAVNGGPPRPAVFAVLARNQLDSKNYQQALASIGSAIRTEATNLDYYQVRAEAERALGQSDFEVTRHLAAGFVQAGDALAERGKKGAALDIYGQSVKLLANHDAPTLPDAYHCDVAATLHKIALLITEIGSKAKAAEYLQSEFSSVPKAGRRFSGRAQTTRRCAAGR